MNMKKMGIALSLTAAFGLMACDDSSSASSENKDNGANPTCSVSSDKNSVTTTMTKDGMTATMVAKIEDGYVVSTTTFTNTPKAEIDEACADEKADEDNVEVTCKDNVITTKMEADGITLSTIKAGADYGCKAAESGKFDLNDDDEDEAKDEQQNQSEEKQDQGEKAPVDDNQGNEPADDGEPDAEDSSDDENQGGNVLPGLEGLDLGDVGTDCSEEGAKKDGNVMGMDMPLVCTDGSWVVDEEATEEMFSCTAEEEGSKKQMDVAGVTMDMVCEDGEWVADQSCSEEGATKTMEVMGLSVDMVCHDGEWISDDSCTEEGATKEMMGFPMVCQDGEWVMNMSF
jgi:hypothetical protein